MCPIVDGMSVDANNTNTQLLDAINDDFTIGKLGLKNTAPASGAFVNNLQQAVNTIHESVGSTETVPATTYGAPSNTINDGDNHKVALTDLANKFHPISGHTHDGTAGNGPQIIASNIASVPLMGFVVQGTTFTPGAVTSYDVTSLMTGKTPSTGSASTGVVVTTSLNATLIRYASGANTDDVIKDGSGNIVFGRITYSAGTWLLSFYVNISGTDTLFTMPAATDIKWYFQELYNPMVSTPVYSPMLVMPSDNTTADVVDATTTQSGKVLLSSTSPSDIAATASIGSSSTVARADHVHKGVHSLGIYGDSTKLYGDVDLEAGSNVTLTRTLQRIKIDTTGAVAYQEELAGVVNGINATFGPMTFIPSDNNSVLVLVDFVGVPLSGYSISSNSIVFNAGYIPQPGQNVYVYYVTTGTPLTPPTFSGTPHTEYHTVTSGEETAKSFSLAFAPALPANSLVDIIGGTSQQWAVDFTITGTTFSWSGLGLDGFLNAGDVVRLFYIS